MPGLPVLPSPRLPREVLLTLVQTISGVPVVWSTRKRGFLGLKPGAEKAWIVLGAQSLLAVGVDELRTLYDPAKDQNVQLLVGQRQFTLTVRAFSYDASLEAFDLCERVRFRMRTQTARAIFVPILALRDFGPTVTLDEETENTGGVIRTILVATLDVRMSFCVAADPGDANSYITSVNGPTGLVPGTLLP